MMIAEATTINRRSGSPKVRSTSLTHWKAKSSSNRLGLRQIDGRAAACWWLAMSGSLVAVPPELTALVPGDAVAAYVVSKPPRVSAVEGGRSSFEFAALLIDRAFDAGLLQRLPDTSRGWLDAIAALSVVFEHPHAVVLLDVRIEQADEDSHRLGDLQGAIVLRTMGRNGRIERRIQHLLASYTNAAESRLESFELDGATFHRLHDRRLADWLMPTWGAMGDHFMIAIGRESAESIARTMKESSASLSADRWFREGVSRLAAADALLTVYVQFDRLRRSADKVLARKTDGVLDAIGLSNSERTLWALGYAGKSLEIRQWSRGGAKDTALVLAGASLLEAEGAPPVPEAASAFAAIGFDPKTLVGRSGDAWLSARSPKNAQRSRDYWHDIETRGDFRFSTDFFDLLGGPIVIHDFPRHPLRLPPAWTIVAPIRGDADRVRKSLDGLMNAWKQDLESSESRLLLRRDDDGVWCLVIGIDGPAVTVSDRFVLISFSPLAVRENLQTLSGK